MSKLKVRVLLFINTFFLMCKILMASDGSAFTENPFTAKPWSMEDMELLEDELEEQAVLRQRPRDFPTHIGPATRAFLDKLQKIIDVAKNLTAQLKEKILEMDKEQAKLKYYIGTGKGGKTLVRVDRSDDFQIVNNNNWTECSTKIPYLNIENRQANLTKEKFLKETECPGEWKPSQKHECYANSMDLYYTTPDYWHVFWDYRYFEEKQKICIKNLSEYETIPLTTYAGVPIELVKFLCDGKIQELKDTAGTLVRMGRKYSLLARLPAVPLPWHF